MTNHMGFFPGSVLLALHYYRAVIICFNKELHIISILLCVSFVYCFKLYLFGKLHSSHIIGRTNCDVLTFVLLNPNSAILKKNTVESDQLATFESLFTLLSTLNENTHLKLESLL